MDQIVKGADGRELTGSDWLSLNDQNRAIALDYPMLTSRRDFSHGGGYRILVSYLERHVERYRELIATLPELEGFFKTIEQEADPASLEPYWNNGWFPPLDSLSLCALLHRTRPRRYVEVGSGNSTKFARKLIEHFELPTQIVSIDPYPRADIDQLCDTAIRCPLESVDPTFFQELTAEDIFFLDSSHRSFQNSDVTVFFMEILPSFPAHMIYGLHDIFIPFDYPQTFLPRFYNEQFLLAAYLIGGSKDEALFPSAYLAHSPISFPELGLFARRLRLGQAPLDGGAFWARKAPT